MKLRLLLASALLAPFLFPACGHAADPPTAAAAVSTWKVGDPIVSYWAGPGFPGGLGGDLTDTAATQLKEGGWNLVWCRENELDVAHRHGLRGMISSDLLNPATLDDPKKREALDALISRVSRHPAFYTYHLTDEPSAAAFPAIGRLVAYLRERDPAHLGYINLLPTYANNGQLGTPGGTVEAYNGHLRQFVETVRPALLSYDHYQFTNTGDQPDYFLNLSLIREKARASGLPFMNIVQASAWGPTPLASPQGPRVPVPEEMRYLVYTTLAYGAQGISYYVYCYPQHLGGIARPDGTTTPLYDALKSLNPEFVSIARELQPLRPLAIHHAGMRLPGTVPPPADSVFTFDPPVPALDYKPGDRVQGVLISQFGPAEKPDAAPAAPAANAGSEAVRVTHLMVVNLDYKTERAITLRAPASLEVFDAAKAQWLPASGSSRAQLHLPGGGGKLLRLRP
ncbi:MAG: hypothetical protein V4726_09045 [Verrucomicrobiota bacterium]